MSERQPYSRVYWSILDDEKFDTVRADMRLLGSWALLLVVADMAYPAPAFSPSIVSRKSLTALANAGLVEILPAGMFRVTGLKSERERRAASASRLGPIGTPTGTQAGPKRDPDASPRATRVRRGLDETRQGLDEDEHRARLGPSDDETTVLSFLARHGAFIRPESGFGQRVIGLVARRGVAAVIEEAERMAQTGNLSDRQWVFGLEERLENIPQAPRVDARAAAADELIDKRSSRIAEQMHKGRVEWFRNTGEWNPDYGPEPRWEPAWGERPGVAA